MENISIDVEESVESDSEVCIKYTNTSQLIIP